MSERLDRCEYRLRRAGGDGDFALGVVGMAVEARHLGGDGLAQSHDAGHQRILVVARTHRRVDQIDQRGVDRIIGKSLSQVDRAVLLREGRHHREDRRAGGRKLGANVECHSRSEFSSGAACSRFDVADARSDARCSQQPDDGDGHPAHSLSQRSGGAQPDRQYAAGRVDATGHRPLPPVRQARKPESRRVDQGPHRAGDDRRRRAGRAGSQPGGTVVEATAGNTGLGSRWSRAPRAIACCW